jgi:Tfp pilus assembly protein PilX
MGLKINKKQQAYSLLEMIVTLLLTGLIMLALINLVSTILRVSAISYNRSLIREELGTFVDEFEKDIRNSSRVGTCSGSGATFKCDFYTDNLYRWESCSRDAAFINECKSNSATCDYKNIQVTMCKYLVDASSSTLPEVGQPLVRFDDKTNLDQFSVRDVTLSTDPNANTDQVRRVIEFTAVASSPNKRLNINNIFRQSIVTTKNFELVVKAN